MAENLNFETGESMCYNDSYTYCEECGRFYQYADALKACPEGWHLPTDNDWIVLEISMGMYGTEARASGWRGTPPGQAPLLMIGGKSGLDLGMCGVISPYFDETQGSIVTLKSSGFHKETYFWSATAKSNYSAWSGHFKNRASIKRSGQNKNDRLNVRCVKDSE